jgi:putative Ca2+/H+ antiporter (TMEM165/GDT1 family)
MNSNYPTFIKTFLFLFLFIFSFCAAQEPLSNQQLEPLDKTTDVTQVKLKKEFVESIFSSFTLIFISEIGDKTFFLVMIYSMSNSALKIFFVTSSIMAFMTLAAVIVGYGFNYFLNRTIINWMAVISFTIFASMMYYNAYTKKTKLVEEKFKKQIKKLENKESQETTSGDKENNLNQPLIGIKQTKAALESVWPLVISLTIGELGDNSQVATIVLGAVQNFMGVVIGGTIAHACCTLVAISFGNLIAKKLTTTQINLASAIMFTMFAFLYLLEIFNIKFF